MITFGENSPFVLAWYQRMQRREQEEGRENEEPNISSTYFDFSSPNNSSDSIPGYIRTHLFTSSQQQQRTRNAKPLGLYDNATFIPM
jgi:hypothetical protein